MAPYALSRMFQRGHGVGGVLANLAGRYAIPILKSQGKKLLIKAPSPAHAAVRPRPLLDLQCPEVTDAVPVAVVPARHQVGYCRVHCVYKKKVYVS